MREKFVPSNGVMAYLILSRWVVGIVPRVLWRTRFCTSSFLQLLALRGVQCCRWQAYLRIFSCSGFVGCSKKGEQRQPRRLWRKAIALAKRFTCSNRLCSLSLPLSATKQEQSSHETQTYARPGTLREETPPFVRFSM